MSDMIGRKILGKKIDMALASYKRAENGLSFLAGAAVRVIRCFPFHSRSMPERKKIPSGIYACQANHESRTTYRSHDSTLTFRWNIVYTDLLREQYFLAK
jgi:hypothetical protein